MVKYEQCTLNFVKVHDADDLFGLVADFLVVMRYKLGEDHSSEIDFAEIRMNGQRLLNFSALISRILALRIVPRNVHWIC
jgi:hypothetical protein